MNAMKAGQKLFAERAEKKYTKRELVLAQRRAWADSRYALSPTWAYDTLYAEATKRYPLPRVTRPRVVKDDFGISWKVVDNEFQWQGTEGEWISSKLYGSMCLSAERVRLWADLLANPTETVEEGE